MDEPALLVFWEGVVGLVLDRVAGFPRVARYVVGARIEARTLDVLECLAEARYASGAHRSATLARADTHLAVLRVLLRLSHERRWLTMAQLELLARRLDEAGRMLGGWRKWSEQVGD